MKNSNKIFIDDYNNIHTCFQYCINTYNGKHGKTAFPTNRKDNINFIQYHRFEIILHPDTKVEFDIYFNYHTLNLYIAFQGSSSIGDWKSNLDAFSKVNIDENSLIIPYNNNETKIRIHKGFYDQYQIARDMILKYIYDLTSPIYNIYVTGHSLGGALSSLCAIDLQYHFGNNNKLNIHNITLGSPRVGNKEFVESFNKRIKYSYRFVYKTDTVEKVPLVSMGYKHIGNTIRLSNGFEIADLLPYRWLIGSPFYHYPQLYLKAFENTYTDEK